MITIASFYLKQSQITLWIYDFIDMDLPIKHTHVP